MIFEEILYYSFPNIRLNYLFYEEDAFIFLLFELIHIFVFNLFILPLPKNREYLCIIIFLL